MARAVRPSPKSAGSAKLVSLDKTADVLADAARGRTTPDEQPTLEIRAERRSGDVGAADEDGAWPARWADHHRGSRWLR